MVQWPCGSGIVFGRVGLLVADFGFRRGFLVWPWYLWGLWWFCLWISAAVVLGLEFEFCAGWLFGLWVTCIREMFRFCL